MVWERQALQSDSAFSAKYPWGDDGEVAVPLTELDDYGLTKMIPDTNLEQKIQEIDVEPQDKLILTSDGLHEYMQITEMEAILNTAENLGAENAARALVAYAKKGEAIPGVRPGQ